MLTVSLHCIRLQEPYGLYPEEHVLQNEFEIDVDIWLPHDNVTPWPFVDYVLINKIVTDVFSQQGQLLEHFVHNIHTAIKQQITAAQKVKVAVRKLHPPMSGDVKFAQVCYEA